MAEGDRHEIARRLQWLHIELKGKSLDELRGQHRRKLGEYWEAVQAVRETCDVGPGYIGPLAAGMSEDQARAFAATEREVTAEPAKVLANRLRRG